MSESGSHLDPKEATEAKLCAYLEGELSPGDRVEIEQHLIVNPQHRQLLADLAKTRGWMRAIPRETSPIDLGEVFQGHVERSMLLDDSGDNSTGMSLNRWPQYLLVAAVTAVALGLGVVLVAILKSPANNATLAIQNRGNSSILPSPITPATSPVLPQVAGADREQHNPIVAPDMPDARPIIASSPPSGEAGGGGGIQKMMTRRADPYDSAEIESLKIRLSTAGVRVPSDVNTVCFVVTADSPGVAVEQVRGFFDRHQIAFDTSPGEKPELPSYRMARLGTDNIDDSQRSRDQLAAAPPTRAARGTQNYNGGVERNSQQNQQVQSPPSNQATQNSVPGAANSMLDKDKISTPAPALTQVGETFYIAHGITPLQVELLSASLQGENLRQKVQRLTLIPTPLDALPAQAAVIPIGAIARGESLTVTIPQLVGPGIEKTNIVKVADDGTITLPMIEALPAAGVLPADLQQRIADKYRDANLIKAATVTVAIVGPPASSRPAIALGASTKPTTQMAKETTTVMNPAVAPTPATKPAADLSLVDVIVVIEPSKVPTVPAPLDK